VPSDHPARAAGADVCLVLEGTYPYVPGGVSTWAHDLIRGLGSFQFALVHIGAERGQPSKKHYALPANVDSLLDLYCREPLSKCSDPAPLWRAARAEYRRQGAVSRPCRVLAALRRLHLETEVDPDLLDDLASGDLSVGSFLHGRASLDLTMELCERLAPEASFLDFFWHFRSMHLPLVRLLAVPAPPAATYHALCTGYAGVLGAVWSHRTGRPFLLTEHGIYTRERDLELDRATWIQGPRASRRADEPERPLDSVTASCLRRVWGRFFRALARCAYARASTIISLSEISRRRQIADGAAPGRTLVIPNGIDLEALQARLARGPRTAPDGRTTQVGFVGRLVPIKNMVTFLRACSLASRTVDIVVRVFGPPDEDPEYVRRCRRLVASLGLGSRIRFEGLQPIEAIYAAIDMLVLTSFSEGQPLVVLEANAAGIPVIASDVGACRDLIEGRDEADRRIGPGGIVTRLADPEETAAAIVRLALDPALRQRMGAAGRQRVAAYYRQSVTLARYAALYGGGSWPASVGASSA
jgi:polysaccharide biosynthesis protein PelF